MYITTFYSFKGGVGRSMALANAGVELARRGRKVLLVDFDLEAPGLDTFDCLKLPKTVPGIVDFVSEYSATGQAPEVERFVEKCVGLGESQGEVLLMPAGTSKSTYGESFRRIDWGELYEKRDGYLLFEDLKAQWKEVIQPDYVLIDSRTGHTDVGGICTRQLPDSVAVLFFPNEQNLIGLTKVVRDIRSEAEEPRAKQIHLHFIMSNVPDLDDEDRILERKIKAFQKKLDFERDPLIVHRYDSLSLSNQVVFTKDRPRSRLAGEYRRIVKAIVRRNLRDREGALDYLKNAEKVAHLRSIEFESIQEAENKLSLIESSHENDSDVLFHLGVLRQERWEPKLAASLFGRAIEKGYAEPRVHLRRARVLSDIGKKDEAGAEAIRALQHEELSLGSIRRALMLIGPDAPSRVGESPALASLGQTERIGLAHHIFFEAPELRDIALLILKPVAEDGQLKVESSEKRNQLALVYIATAQFDAAANLLAYEAIQEVDIQTAFNYSVATWGAHGSADAEAFKGVIQLHEDKGESGPYDSANYFQCIALAYWVVGDKKEATEQAFTAEKEALSNEETFSCWRYRNVSTSGFIEDLEEMMKFFSGDTLFAPPFLSPDSTSSDFSQD